MALSNAQHEAVYRACMALLTNAGARAALLCEAAGTVLAAFGDVSAEGEPSGTMHVSAHETVVHGAAGDMYGVDLPGGLLLAVLHDGTQLDLVRAESASAAAAISDALSAPQAAAAPPPTITAAELERPRRARKKKRAKAKPAARKQKKPARAAKKPARPSKKKPARPAKKRTARKRR